VNEASQPGARRPNEKGVATAEKVRIKNNSGYHLVRPTRERESERVKEREEREQTGSVREHVHYFFAGMERC
jgi:hypothetical protein